MRVRKVLLPEGLSGGQIDELLHGLRKLDAVHEVTRAGDGLVIAYDFPLHGFETAWQLISSHSANAGCRLPYRFRHAMFAFMEATERGHLLSRSGWEKYVQDIHVDYHRRRAQQSVQKRKAWQQYKPGKPAAN